MDLITTHINADFDALGSLVAAKKLYPNARLLLPGSQERAVRDFLSLCKDIIVVEHEKGCSLDGVDRLILVDTRHRSRIGIASALVDRGAEVHIYDHHPHMKDDIVADKEFYDEVGATVSILADLIRRKHIKLSYLEATIMLLGIYEETGSLTYRTTTKLDVDMVSFLLSQGANLSVVSRYLNRELSEEELSFLAQLISRTERMVVNGVSVSMAEIESMSFSGEMGMLIHKLLDVENIPVLFVFVRSGATRINIIARSRLPNVDVNKILANFGGGGHPSAASCKVKSGDINALKAELLRVLKATIKVQIYAKDIMAKQIKAIDVNEKVRKAKSILLKENVPNMPVIDKGKVVGIASLVDMNRAIRNGFGHARVKGYMGHTVIAIGPMAPLHAIQKIIAQKDVGILPVVENGKTVGVVHRTDVLRNVYSTLFAKPHAAKSQVIVNLSHKMETMLPASILKLLKRIGQLSNKEGFGAFLVGGVVRDLLLGVKNLDLDIVVEGSAIDIGHTLARQLDAAFIVHRRFGTCTVVTKDKLKIDLATARKEVYEKPAALPTVEFSSLKNDMIRRDFTINAMAISLNKANFGQLIDFFGGQNDLRHGRIKVMHDGSFIDDPTRIFRAVRFEQRFGFAMDSHTEDLIRYALEEEMFKKTEKQRIRDEIILILKEKNALNAVKRMAELHEFRFIHRHIILDRHIIRLFNVIDRSCAWYDRADVRKRPVEKWLIFFLALCDYLTHKEMAAICDAYVFKKSEVVRMLSNKEHGKTAIELLSSKSAIKPSQVYAVLEPLSFEEVLFLMAKADPARATGRIRDFFLKYSGVRIKIGGDDIRKLGITPGPVFKHVLEKVLYRRIDGKIKNKRDELEYAKKLIKRYENSRS